MKKSETSATGLSRRSPLYLIAVLLLAVIIFLFRADWIRARSRQKQEITKR